MINLVDGAVFRQMVIEAAYAIDVHKKELNDLNVFPVPDGDTGINMSMTIGAADTLLHDHEYDSLGEAAAAIVAAVTLFFRLDHIAVTGNERYTEE